MKFKKARKLYVIIASFCVVMLFAFRNLHPYVTLLISILLGISTLYFIYLLISGAIFIQRNFYLYSHNKLPYSSEKQICLSFDDGVHFIFTNRILDILKEHQIKAMFFIIGKNIDGNETIVQRMFQDGHTIGNHSFNHSFWFDMKMSKAMQQEIDLTNKKLVDVLGSQFKPKYFRPPYGVTNPALATAIYKCGMISIGWNIRSMDTTMKFKELLLQKLKSFTKPGAMILLHDRCEITTNALTDYIVFCKEQGYTFTTIT